MSNKQIQRGWQFAALVGLIASLILMLLVSLLSGSRQVSAEFGMEWPEIEFVPLISRGLSNPVQLIHAGDSSGRLFIVEKGGRIRIYKDGVLLDEPFLDIRHLVNTFNERGLLGLAFSPDYVNDGDFYVNYTDNVGDTQIVRYHVSANPDVADPDSAEIVLSVEQFSSNHNGGQTLFGADGYLYIGMGDGGGQGDVGNRAQNPTLLLGKMLRIDVETDDPLTYTIPLDNPFIDDSTTRDEIWALGLRNPWRFSFDSQTGDLYMGDVGQYQWEEINFQPAGVGGQNYGWRCYEGNHEFNAIDCASEDEYTFPIHEYNHRPDGQFVHCSVTGGVVYRGNAYARMQGIYFYIDYCSGYLWGLRKEGLGWQNQQLNEWEFGVTSFGEDEAGNLYVTLQGSNGAGSVYQLTDPNGPTPTPTTPHTPSNTPTAAHTPSNTPTAAHTPSNTPTAAHTPSNTPTAAHTPSNTPTAAHTPTNTPSATAISASPTTTVSNTPTAAHTPTNTPSATAISASPTATISNTPTASVPHRYPIYLPLILRD